MMATNRKHDCDSFLGKLCRLTNGKSPIMFLLVARSEHYFYAYTVLYDDGRTYEGAVFIRDEIEEVPLL